MRAWQSSNIYQFYSIWFHPTVTRAHDLPHSRWYWTCVVKPHFLFVFTFWSSCCDIRYDIHIKWCSVRLYLQLLVMSYLCYLCLFPHSGVQHILCLFFCVFFCLRLMYPMLPVSLDCPLLFALRCSLTYTYHSSCFIIMQI